MRIDSKEIRELVTDLSEIYMVMTTKSVVSSVYDYLKDIGIDADFQSFRLMCVMLADEENMDSPELIDIKHFHNMLMEDLGQQEVA